MPQPYGWELSNYQAHSSMQMCVWQGNDKWQAMKRYKYVCSSRYICKYVQDYIQCHTYVCVYVCMNILSGACMIFVIKLAGLKTSMLTNPIWQNSPLWPCRKFYCIRISICGTNIYVHIYLQVWRNERKWCVDTWFWMASRELQRRQLPVRQWQAREKVTHSHINTNIHIYIHIYSIYLCAFPSI